MKQIPAPSALELQVKDFGPIVEAQVDLRPLTVFIGPSNTGKSYLAILIYALHRHFSNGPLPMWGLGGSSRSAVPKAPWWRK